MLEKIKAGEKLSEYEIRELVYGYSEHDDEGENRRWSQSVSSYIELEGEGFAIEWERGLTEMQEDEFYNQPEPAKLEKRVVEITQIVYK